MSGNSFIRGGQVLRHSYKMFAQVMRTVRLVFMICFVCFFTAKMFLDISSREWYLGYQFYLAKANLCIPFQKSYEAIQRFTFNNGYVGSIRAVDLVNNRKIQATVNKIYTKLINNAIYSAILAFAIFISCIIGFWLHGRRKAKKKTIKGNYLTTPKKLAKILRRKKVASKLKIGSVPLVRDTEVQHISVTGSTGSGKTNFINCLLPQIRARGDKVFIIDTSGSFVEHYYKDKQDVIFNPFDQRSVGWDLWQECNNIGQYDLLANACIPPQTNSFSDEFWQKAGSKLFSTALKKFAYKGLNKQVNPARALHSIFCRYPLAKLAEFFSDTDAVSISARSADKTTENIRSNIGNNIQWLRYIDSNKNDNFSFREWMKNEDDKRWVFVTSNADSLSTLAPLMSTVFTIATNELMRIGESSTRRVWFIIDELTSLSCLNKLEDSLKLLRKYGGCVVSGFQNIHQIYKTYGHDEAKSILSQFNTKAYFKEDQPETVRHIADTLGKSETIEPNENIGYGADSHRDGVNINNVQKLTHIVSPSDIGMLQPLECYLKLAGNYPITKIKLDYQDLAKQNEAFIERNFGLDLEFIQEKDDQERKEEKKSNDNSPDNIKKRCGKKKKKNEEKIQEK